MLHLFCGCWRKSGSEVYRERLGIVEAVRNLESSGSGVHHLPSEHRLADNILQ